MSKFGSIEPNDELGHIMHEAAKETRRKFAELRTLYKKMDVVRCKEQLMNEPPVVLLFLLTKILKAASYEAVIDLPLFELQQLVLGCKTKWTTLLTLDNYKQFKR